MRRSVELAGASPQVFAGGRSMGGNGTTSGDPAGAAQAGAQSRRGPGEVPMGACSSAASVSYYYRTNITDAPMKLYFLLN
jgi:hypothetical protein